MKVTVKMVLEQDEQMKRVALTYVDDIYVNEDILSADEVKSRLESFSLSSKDPTRLRDGAIVLGVKVWEGVQHTAVEVRKLSSRTHYTDATHSIFYLWEVPGTFSCPQVASCSYSNDKKMSKHGNEGVAWLKNAPLKQMIVEMLTRVSRWLHLRRLASGKK